MAAFLIVLMFLAGFHFLYDGIILPGIRQHYRNKLFALRDQLRWLVIRGLDNSDLAAFNLVHDSINVFVNRLPLITVSMKVDFEKDLKNNEKLQKTINDRIRTIEACKNKEIKKIAKEVNFILLKTFTANTGSWFIYIIPIAFALIAFETATLLLSKLAFAPVHEVHKVIPTTDKSALCG